MFIEHIKLNINSNLLINKLLINKFLTIKRLTRTLNDIANKKGKHTHTFFSKIRIAVFIYDRIDIRLRLYSV